MLPFTLYIYFRRRRLCVSINARVISVAATEEKFDLTCRKRTIGDKDGVEVTCMAKGLYPQPSLDISVE